MISYVEFLDFLIPGSLYATLQETLEMGCRGNDPVQHHSAVGPFNSIRGLRGNSLGRGTSHNNRGRRSRKVGYWNSLDIHPAANSVGPSSVN